MALLEYNLEYDEKTGTSKVTCQILQVDKGDKISFKSNYEYTGIKYVKGSPFAGASAPKAGVVFEVGAGTKGPFTVTKSLTTKSRLHFDCGEMVQQAATAGKGATSKATPAFKSWGSGNDTPPGDG